jgi:hypothetical protein
LGLVVARRKGLRGGRLFAIVALAPVAASLATIAVAQDDKDGTDKKQPTIRELLRDLGDGDKAEQAVQALVARGSEAVPLLKGDAIEGTDMMRRGWAIVALSEIGGKEVEQLFIQIQGDEKQSMLVRTWAAAGRVSMAKSTDELLQLAGAIPQFPALGRPIGLRLIESLADKDKPATPEQILSVSLRVPQLQQALAPAILALGSEKLTNVLTTSKDQEVRRQSAGYLGALYNQGDKSVAEQVIKVYKFDPETKEAAWNGGPLFLPGIQWPKEQAQELVGNLISWHLWCDRHKKAGEQQQIHNNLAGVGLGQMAGYQPIFGQNVTTVQWLEVWGKAVGRKEIERMLKEQGVDADRKYSGVLERL